MQTPVEHILSSLEGLEFAHLVPLIIMTCVVVIVSIVRRDKPNTYVWRPGKGLAPRLEALRDKQGDEAFEELCETFGLTEEDIKTLREDGHLE
ncbi:MAG: hypothetical protein AAFS13_03595 [Pseudomonadota bacterium]